MYQYKAILKSSKKIIAEDHTLEGILAGVTTFKRGQKRGEHTKANEPVEIYHVYRDGSKEKLLKTV